MADVSLMSVAAREGGLAVWGLSCQAEESHPPTPTTPTPDSDWRPVQSGVTRAGHAETLGRATLASLSILVISQ